MWQLPSHLSRPDSTSPARLAAASLIPVALLVAGCGDDSSSSSSGAAEAVGASGCEPGETSGGTDPGDAPAVPDDLGASLDQAIETTRNLSSAALSYGIDIDGPYGSQGISVDGEIDSAGVSVVRARADEGDGTQATAYCSDGETGWIHIEAASVAEEMPDGVDWLEAPEEELEDLGIVYDMETVWQILPILRGMTVAEDGGTRDVAGVPVRVLSGEVDYQAALDAASPEEEQHLAATISSDPEAAYGVEVGLDGAGVVRFLQVSVDAEVGVPGETEGEAEGETESVALGITMEIRATDPTVGAPTPPASDRTVPLADVPEVQSMLSA